MKKLARNLVFFIYTYIIANSIFIATAIINFEICSPKVYLDNFLNYFCQFDIFRVLFEKLLDEEYLSVPLIALFYEFNIFMIPVLLWWRKQTVLRAWLLATAGVFLPMHLAYIFSHYPPIDYSPVIFMTAAYLTIFLIKILHGSIFYNSKRHGKREINGNQVIY